MSSVLDCVFRAIDVLNATLPPERRLAKSPETALMGGAAALDSLEMVNLVVETEMAIEEVFDRTINLADQAAIEQAENPFESVASFAGYIESLLK